MAFLWTAGTGDVDTSQVVGCNRYWKAQLGTLYCDFGVSGSSSIQQRRCVYMNGNKFVQRFQIYSKLDCVPGVAIRIPMQLKIVSDFAVVCLTVTVSKNRSSTSPRRLQGHRGGELVACSSKSTSGGLRSLEYTLHRRQLTEEVNSDGLSKSIISANPIFISKT
jgi:hypothetical protein